MWINSFTLEIFSIIPSYFGGSSFVLDFLLNNLPDTTDATQNPTPNQTIV
jgi:hypothetical protein